MVTDYPHLEFCFVEFVVPAFSALLPGVGYC